MNLHSIFLQKHVIFKFREEVTFSFRLFFSLPNVANNEKREVHVVLSGGLQQTSENTFFCFWI